MAAIADGVGTSISPAQPAGRWAVALPPSPEGRTDRNEPAVVAGRSGVEPVGDLGRLYGARSQGLTEAVHVRQTVRKLDRVAGRAQAVQEKLDRVKLYPPYPTDEPERAKAIREFNGVAQEVKRMIGTGEGPVVELKGLRPGATPVELDRAAQSAREVTFRFGAQRTALAQRVSSGAGVEAEVQSRGLGLALGETAAAGLSRRAADLLRQIA